MLWFNVFLANLRKVAIELARYWPNTLSTLITFYTVFLLLFFGIQAVGNPDTTATDHQHLVAVMVLWLLALTAMNGIGWEVMTEAARGTLEQLYMSPIAGWSILLARMMATVLINLVIVAAVLGSIMLTTGQRLRFDLVTLTPLFVLTVTGMLGVGFVLAGLALVFKQVSALLQIAQFGALILVALPVTMSHWLELAPVVRGASMLRVALTGGLTIGGFPPLEWAVLGANAVLYLIVGIGTYKLAERKAMRAGLLGQY
jgi:ABC-2 type transport system permease protein